MRTGLIDLKEDSISLYIVEKAKDGYKHIDTITASLNGKRFGDVILEFSRKQIKNIYLSLPLNMLSLRELEFPFSDRRKIDETIAFELDGLLLGNVNDYVVEPFITYTGEDGCKVIAICIEKRKLKEIIDDLSKAGIEPIVITSLGLQHIDSYIKGESDNEDERISLALNELKRPTINLRKGEFRYTGVIDSLKRSFRLTLILCIVLLLIYGTGNLVRYKMIKEKNRLLLNTINETYLKTFPDENKIIDPLRQFKGRVNQLVKMKAVFGSSSPIDTLKGIANLMDNEIRLDEFKYEDGMIIIKGVAKGFEDIESFKNRLSSQYNDVKVINSELSIDNRTNFTITMKEME